MATLIAVTSAFQLIFFAARMASIRLKRERNWAWEDITFVISSVRYGAMREASAILIYFIGSSGPHATSAESRYVVIFAGSFLFPGPPSPPRRPGQGKRNGTFESHELSLTIYWNRKLLWLPIQHLGPAHLQNRQLHKGFLLLFYPILTFACHDQDIHCLPLHAHISGTRRTNPLPYCGHTSIQRYHLRNLSRRALLCMPSSHLLLVIRSSSHWHLS